MNDGSYEELEQRLGRLDLQLSVCGEHLSDERLTEIGSGVDVTDPEATHLSGCDECLEVLMALGEGLEDLSTEQPELSLLMTEAPVARRRTTVTTTLVVLSLAACAMAAAGWYVRGQMDSLSPLTTPSKTEQKATVHSPSEVVPTTPEETLTRTQPVAPKAEAEPAVVAPQAEPVVVTPQASTKTDTSTPAKPSQARTITPRIDAKRRPKRARKVTTVSETPQTTGAGLDGRDGPTAFDRVAVDGAPRGFGQLRLNAKPAARVFIDGKDRGWTPVVDLRLQAGPHDVRLVFESELAERREDRFRVLIESEKTWSTVRDNRKAGLRK